MKKLIHQLLDYNVWANERLCTSISKLSEEQMDQYVPSSFPSVRKTLLHMLGAQQLWMLRLSGTSPTQVPSFQFSSSQELLNSWLANCKELLENGSSFQKEELKEVKEYTTFTSGRYSSRIYEMIMTVVNHGTYHRGQLVTVLRALGVEEIPQTDFIFYTREKQAKQK
jgi:uncharacterized damage-inducible protein DinB